MTSVAHPISAARKIVFSTPPAADTCAPNFQAVFTLGKSDGTGSAERAFFLLLFGRSSFGALLIVWVTELFWETSTWTCLYVEVEIRRRLPDRCSLIFGDIDGTVSLVLRLRGVEAMVSLHVVYLRWPLTGQERCLVTLLT